MAGPLVLDQGAIGPCPGRPSPGVDGSPQPRAIVGEPTNHVIAFESFKIVLGLGVVDHRADYPAQAAAMTTSDTASVTTAVSIRSQDRISGLRLNRRRTGHVIGR